jgi:hypothetical protein
MEIDLKKKEDKIAEANKWSKQFFEGVINTLSEPMSLNVMKKTYAKLFLCQSMHLYKN